MSSTRSSGRPLLAGLLLITVGCVSTAPSTSRGDLADPLLWRVQLPDRPGTLYLLGSVHLAERHRALIDAAVWATLEEADAVVMEANVGRQLDIGVLTMRLGLLPANESLRDHVSEATYQELQSTLHDLSASDDIVRRMRPWLAAITLLALKLDKAGFDPNAGVDALVREAAERRRIPLRYLETVEQQIRLFSSLDPQMQEAFLLDALRTADAKSQVETLIDLYEAGDLGALEEALIAPFDQAPELRARLLDDRNRDWLEQLDAMLVREETLLVTVGAGHLLGPHGMIAELRAAGATVDRQAARGRSAPPPLPRAEIVLDPWQPVRDGGLGFVLQMPGEPTREPIEPLLQLERGSRWVVDRRVVAFAITALFFAPEADSAIEADAPQILTATFRDVAFEVGGTLGAWTQLEFAEGRAEEQIIELPHGRLWVRGYITGARLFELRCVVLDPHRDDPDLLAARDRFFESFAVGEAGEVVLAREPAWHGRAAGPEAR